MKTVHNSRCISNRIVAGVIALIIAAFGLLPAIPLSAFAASDEPPSDRTGKGAGFDSVLYDGTNGLPTSEANAIVQSSDGLIWIGGYCGLIRYDGNEFYRYSSTTHIASVVTLFVDSGDRLWIGTNDSGIALFAENEFTFFGKSAGLRSASIRSLAEDAEGNIIIATTEGLAYIDTERQLRLIDDPLINHEYVCELCLGADGVIYGVTLAGSIFTVENKSVSAFYNSDDMGLGVINTIYPDPKNPGHVYLGSQGSEVYYGDLSDHLKNRETFSASPQTTINSIRLIDDQLWICADNGIGYFAPDGAYIQLVDIPMNNSIDHIMRDYEGNLWFTSSRQGVMKIVQNKFVNISNLAKLDTLVVNSTCKLGDDLYLGTDSGLYIIDGEYGIKETALSQMLAGVRIRCIRKDSRGCMWLCTYSENGLVFFDPESSKITRYTPENGLASTRVRMVTELSDGSIAVATNGGVNIIKDGEVTATYDGNSGISNLEILCIQEGADGKLYLGSDGAGIYKTEGVKVSRIGTESGLQSEVILRIAKDPVEDIYWIITSNSLAYMKEDKVCTIDDFPYSNNFDMFFDENGRIWILSSGGIYVVKRSDLLDGNGIEYTLYDTKCGLPGIATANSYSHISGDGTLYISSSTGVYSVNINENTDDANDIKLAIPFITIDDATVWVRGRSEIDIPADCKRLNIYANAMTYSLNNPHLSYRLTGFDDEPITVTKQEMKAASYTNLAGGDYVFRLSILDEVTGETVKTIELKLVKKQALYEKTWFRIALAVAAVAVAASAVALIYRRKTKKLLKKQQEDKKLINEMTRVFSNCIDMKDAYTNGHSARVAKYTAMMAKKLGKTDEEVEEIYNIALLHDIGKISIPDNILNKPGRLDDDEYKVMKTHSPRGYEILKNITIAPGIALGAGYHHERYDGKGYPNGLKGDEIPEIAQIIAVADTFDAMYSTRPYRKQLPLDQVVAEIKRCAGTQLSPRAVGAFLSLVEEGAFDKKEEAPTAPDEQKTDPANEEK